MKQEGIPAKGARGADSDWGVRVWYVYLLVKPSKRLHCAASNIFHVSCQFDCQSNMSVRESRDSISMVLC